MMIAITDLEKAIADAPTMMLPHIIGQLAALQALAHLRLMNPGRAAIEDVMLTIPEVAKHLKVSCYRAYELARQGILPSIRLGKSVRVRSSAVMEFLAKQGG